MLRRILRGRKYKSGTSWCLWRWTDVRSEYITRLHLIKTPWFAICVHWLNHPDPEPDRHDHPVSFLSLILRGRYIELRGEPPFGDMVTRNWFNFVRATDTHQIVWVAPRTTTICLMGPKVREWGFHTPKGWVRWKDYYADVHSARDPQ